MAAGALMILERRMVATMTNKESQAMLIVVLLSSSLCDRVECVIDDAFLARELRELVNTYVRTCNHSPL